MFAALLALLASLLGEAPFSRTTTAPGAVERLLDQFWKYAAVVRTQSQAARISGLEARITAELTKLPQKPTIRTSMTTETKLKGDYGVLPEVYVDKTYGARFPRPIQDPERISWFATLLKTRQLATDVDALETYFDQWLEQPLEVRAASEPALESLWTATTARLTELAIRVRYLEAWTTKLQEGRQKISDLFALVQDPAVPEKDRLHVWGTLRDLLRPHRVLRRPFLPDQLKAGDYVIPVVTDISSAKFLAEIEGAVDSHWNESGWARARKVRFRIRWKKVAPNKAFSEGLKTLDEHLASFPADSVAITTGAHASFSRKNVLALAPGRITPRTLAHEFGHLLGFEDCYFRTLAGYGKRGMEVLEWSNPIYPDDLMCDDSEGVARAAVW